MSKHLLNTDILLNSIIHDDVLSAMKRFPDKSINCIITSPPYWQLRDYGFTGQWGLEPTYQEYLEHLWSLMDEGYRVLKDDGTIWINLGDTYGGSGNRRGHTNETSNLNRLTIGYGATTGNQKATKGLEKCLLLIPHRFAIGCIDRGWILRNDVIWPKRNGMPESTRDRFSKKHEFIFFFVKHRKYRFDLNSIREKHADISIRRAFSNNHLDIRKNKDKNEFTISNESQDKYYQKFREEYSTGNIKGKNPGDVADFWNGYKILSFDEYLKQCIEYYFSEDDFWDVPTKPSSEKHFATYNTKLIDKPIIAGCPEGGIILDPFCGTGTTLTRAIELNRYAIGIDGNKNYCEIAERRLIRYKEQIHLFNEV